jgi:signal transduction histidine kinase
MLVTESGPARAAFERLVASCAAGLRAGSAAVAAGVAFTGLGPPASGWLVAAAVAAVAGWSAAYALLLARRGWLALPMAADIAVAAGLCLAAGRLVPSSVLSDGSSWVFLLASTTVIVSQLGPWRVLGVLAIAVVPAANAAGVLLAGAAGPPWFALLLAVQGALVASMAGVVRRAGRAADAAIAEHETAEQAAALRAGRRAEERAHNRLLHDSVSATLTVVATGGLPGPSAVLRRQAVHDLAVIECLRAPPVPAPAGAVRDVAGWLAPVAAAAGLVVDAVLAPVLVPEAVGAALAGAITEGLANVRRHAGVGTARLVAAPLPAAPVPAAGGAGSGSVDALAGGSGGVLVELVDAGRGFEPARVPAHRHGLRESVVARMAAVGGSAMVTSRPGGGTRLTLRWPAQPGQHAGG